ncbi:glycosyltransferase [Lutibacter sp. TH_r2]|uniref:glycosyltransferase n=1 Tax=Lutibacter sp. TH_r2 TaxID=3082083 RepID=UPI002954D2F4|nr:glycosyltransferase [Lutibacter sp. TH_r2]MDV7187795.1 glycosyltransferase [Lutibacter sp. TH_r2]
MKKVLIIYPGFPHYRKGIIERLLKSKKYEYYFMGDDKMMKTSIKEYDFKDNPRFFNAKAFKIGSLIFHKNMLSHLLNNKYDAYIFHSSPYWVTILLSVFLIKIKGKPVINWTHGILENKKNLKSTFYKMFYHLFDGFLLYGSYAKKNMTDLGFNKNYLRVIYNSLDYEKQKIYREKLTREELNVFKANLFEKSENPQIIFIGRLTKQKKLKVVIDLISYLKKRNIYINVLFVGDGQEKEILIAYAKKHNVYRNICFYGACYDEFEIYKLLASSTCCISPGEVGLTAIHALNYGTPVISHNDPNNQMPEFEAIINNYNGVLFEYNNFESLTNSLQNWLLKNLDRENVKYRCYEVIDDKFNPNYQNNVINNLVDDLLK